MGIDFDLDHAGGLPPWHPSPDAGRETIERIEADAREAARDRIAAEPDRRAAAHAAADARRLLSGARPRWR